MGDLGLSHHTFIQRIMSLTTSHGYVNSTKPCRGSDATLSCRKVKKTIYGRTIQLWPKKCTPKYHIYLIT